MAFKLVSFVIALAILCSCGNDSLTSIIAQSDKSTKQISGEFASCYEDLTEEDNKYQLNFDKACVDSVISNTTVDTIYNLSNLSKSLDGETIKIRGYYRDSEGRNFYITETDSEDFWVAAGVGQRQLSFDVLILTQSEGNNYLNNLQSGKQYIFTAIFEHRSVATGRMSGVAQRSAEAAE